MFKGGDMKEEMNDLGYANGWRDTPEEVQKCNDLGHRGYSINRGNCLNEYGCEICGYKYLVDSSD
jgi:hypothetical protein